MARGRGLLKKTRASRSSAAAGTGSCDAQGHTKSADQPGAKPLPPPKIETKNPEGLGEAICGDAHNDACEVVHGRPHRQSGFHNWLDGINFDTWLDQGATLNTLSPHNRTNGPVTFNNRSNDYQLNQPISG